MMSRLRRRRLAPHDFATSGLFPCVSQVTICSGRPLTPPLRVDRCDLDLGSGERRLVERRHVARAVVGPADHDRRAGRGGRSDACNRGGDDRRTRARSAASAPFVRTFMTTSLVRVHGTSGREQSRVRLLPRLDEAVERGVERDVDVVARGLAHQRARDQLDLGAVCVLRRPRASTDSAPSPAAWRGRSSPTGRRAARFPRPRRRPCPRRRGRARDGRDRLGRSSAAKCQSWRQTGQRRDRVHGRVEDQLRPLRRAAGPGSASTCRPALASSGRPPR